MSDDASPENLRKFLESDDPAMVRMGISLAKGAGVKVTVKDFERFLKSGDVETIKMGFTFAEEAGVGDEAIELLCERLADDDYEGRFYAAKALGEIGDARAVEPLILAVGNERSGSYAAEALGEIGDARAVEPLIGVLSSSDYPGVHCRAAEALGKIGDARAVEPLIEALNDSGEENNPSNSKFAAGALGKIGNARAVEGLIEALVNDDGNALEPLIRIGEPAVEPLVEMADHLFHYEYAENDWGIFQVADALMGIGVMRLEPFIRALGNEEYNVRYTAAEVLEHILNEGLITYSGRYWAAVELDDFHERCSSIKALGDENEYVREAAKEALKKLGHEVE